jgi:pre-mRNA processing factor 3 (PRP3)
MKVLTSDAVQDPTRVEARVRREVAIRKHQHEKMNAERKLTDEQRREKVESKKLEEEKRGIWGAVFKYVNTLVPLHSYADSLRAGLRRYRTQHIGSKSVRTQNNGISLVYVSSIRRLAWSTSRVHQNSSETIND